MVVENRLPRCFLSANRQKASEQPVEEKGIIDTDNSQVQKRFFLIPQIPPGSIPLGISTTLSTGGINPTG
jgi:hypothetical protein